MAWSLAADTARWLHQRLTDHIDQHVWPKAPPPPPLPGLPTPPLPALPALPEWAVAPAVAGAAGAGATDPEPRPGPTAPLAAPVGASYSDQVAQGIACLACTRGHLATAQQALATAQATTDPGMARRQWAVAAAELDAMMALDWAPEKLAATPAEERAIIEAIRPCVTDLRAQLPTPADVAVTHGLAVESRRFALSTRFTPRDQAEIEARLRAIDAHGNTAERISLGPDHAEAAQALREARHVLDRAQMDGGIYRPDTWTAVLAHTEAAAVAATPPLAPADAAAATAACRTCTDEFYRRYLALMQARRSGQPA